MKRSAVSQYILKAAVERAYHGGRCLHMSSTEEMAEKIFLSVTDFEQKPDSVVIDSLTRQVTFSSGGWIRFVANKNPKILPRLRKTPLVVIDKRTDSMKTRDMLIDSLYRKK